MAVGREDTGKEHADWLCLDAQAQTQILRPSPLLRICAVLYKERD